MTALRKGLTGFFDANDEAAFLARLGKLRAELETVPVGIFTAGTELTTVNKLNGFGMHSFSTEELDRVEARIAEHKKTK